MSMAQIRVGAPPPGANHKNIKVIGSSNDISVTQVREFSMIESNQVNPTASGEVNPGPSPQQLPEKGSSQPEFNDSRRASMKQGNSDQLYETLPISNQNSGKLAKESENLSPATLRYEGNDLNAEMQVFPANKALMGKIGINHKPSQPQIELRPKNMIPIDDQFLKENMLKIQRWEEHHCIHCKHFKFFINSDIFHTQGPQEQERIIDIGSLMLKEILQQQRLGGCCKSFCTHCRRDHVCTQKRKVAVIDMEKGADAYEGKNRSRSISPQLQYSHRFLEATGKYEYSHHQFNQSALKLAQFTQLIDLYQLNVFGKEILRKIKQVRRQQYRKGTKSLPKNLNSQVMYYNQMNNMGIDGYISNQILHQNEIKQYQGNSYKLDPPPGMGEKERISSSSTHIELNQDLSLVKPRPPRLHQIITNSLRDNVAVEKANEPVSIDYSPQRSQGKGEAATPSLYYHLEHNKYDNSAISQNEDPPSSRRKNGVVGPQQYLAIPYQNPNSQRQDAKIQPIKYQQQQGYASNSGSPMKQQVTQITSILSPNTAKKDQSSKTSHGLYSKMYSFGDNNFMTLKKGEFKVNDGEASQRANSKFIDPNQQQIQQLNSRLFEGREFTFKEDAAGSPNSSLKLDLKYDNLHQPANMQISIKSNHTPRQRSKAKIEGSNNKDALPGKSHTSPSDYNSVIDTLHQINEFTDKQQLLDQQNQIKLNIQQIQQNLDVLNNKQQYQNKQFGVNQTRKKIPFNHYKHPQMDQYPFGQVGSSVKESQTASPRKTHKDSFQKKQRKVVISNTKQPHYGPINKQHNDSTAKQNNDSTTNKQHNESFISDMAQREYTQISHRISVQQTTERGVGDSIIHSRKDSEEHGERPFEFQKQIPNQPLIMPVEGNLNNLNADIPNEDTIEQEPNMVGDLQNEENAIQNVSLMQDSNLFEREEGVQPEPQPQPLQPLVGVEFQPDNLYQSLDPTGKSVSDRFQNRMIQFQIASRMEDDKILRNSLEQQNVISQRQADYKFKQNPKKKNSQKQVTFRFDSMEKEKQKMFNLTFRQRKPEPLQIEQNKQSPRYVVHKAYDSTSTPIARRSNPKRPSPSPGKKIDTGDLAEVSLSQIDSSPIKMQSTFFFGTKLDDNQKQTYVGNNELMQTLKLSQNGIGIRAGDPSPFGVGASKHSDSSRLSREESQSKSANGSPRQKRTIFAAEQRNNDQLLQNLIGKMDVKQIKDNVQKGIRIIKDKQVLKNIDYIVQNDKYPSSLSEELGSDIRGSDGGMLGIQDDGSVSPMKSNFDHSKQQQYHIKKANDDRFGAQAPIPAKEINLVIQPSIKFADRANTATNTDAVSQDKQQAFKIHPIIKNKDEKTPYFSKNKPLTQSKSPKSTTQAKSSRMSRISRISNDRKKLFPPPIPKKNFDKNLEIKGNKKELNQNYLSLQLQILGLQNEPDTQEQDFGLAKKVKENLINVQNQDLSNLPTTVIQTAEAQFSDQSLKSQNQIQFSQAVSHTDPISVTHDNSHSISPMSNREQFLFNDDDNMMTVEEKLCKLLSQPKYINYTSNKIMSPISNQTQSLQYNRQVIEDDLTQRYRQDTEQFEHLGLEIQGQIVKMEDPYIAQERLQKRHQIIKKIDQRNKNLQEQSIRINYKKLNKDLIESIGTINVTMENENSNKTLINSNYTFNDINKQSRKKSGRAKESTLVDHSILLNQSLLGDTSTKSNRSTYKKIFNKDGPIITNPKQLKLDIISEQSPSKGLETSSADATERQSSMLEKSRNLGLKNIDASDFSVIRDFILFYSRNRFKRFKHHNKTLDDDIFLNQPILKDKNLLVDLYYKLRQSQKLETDVKSFEERIQGKMDEILEAQVKHREELYKNGTLLPDKDDGSQSNNKERNNQNNQQKTSKQNQSSNVNQLNPAPQSGVVLLKDSDPANQNKQNIKYKDEDEIIFEDQTASQKQQNPGQLNSKCNQNNLASVNDSIISSVKRPEGIYAAFDESLMNYTSNSNDASHIRNNNQSMQPQEPICGGIIDRKSIKFTNMLNFNHQDSKCVRKSELREKFQQNEYIKKVRENLHGRRKNNSLLAHTDPFGERLDSPQSFSQQYQLKKSSELQRGRKMNGDLKTLSVTNQQQEVIAEENLDFTINKKNTFNSSLDGKIRSRGVVKSPTIQDQSSENENMGAQLANRFKNIRRHLNTSQQQQRDAQLSHLSELSACQPIKTSDYNVPQTVKNYGEKSFKYSNIFRESADNRGSQLKSKQFRTSQFNESKFTRSTIYRMKSNKAVQNKDSKEYMEYLTNKKPMLPALGLNSIIQKQAAKSDNNKCNNSDPKAAHNQLKLFHMNLYNERVLLGAEQNEKKAILHELDSLSVPIQHAKSIQSTTRTQENRVSTIFNESITHDGKSTELPSTMRKYLNIVPPWKKEGAHDDHTQYLNFEQQLKHSGESGIDEDGEGQDEFEVNESKRRATPHSSQMTSINPPTPSQFVLSQHKQMDNKFPKHKHQNSRFVRTNLHVMQQQIQEMKATEFTQAKLKMRSQKEERERLLGPQFNSKEILKEQKRQKQVANQELEQLNQFMADGASKCFSD